MLSYFESMAFEGLVVRHQDHVVGVTAGEALNHNTYVIHMEKGKDDYKGIYQFLNQRFAASLDKQFQWINREQDLGLAGLRRAKQSYHPARMGKKFRIQLREFL